MEDKMIKDFDRAIEQMMNEHAVPPPFGAWNRIATELGQQAAPVAARRAVPVGAIGGFVAGALLIGGIVAGVLVYNGNQLNNITYPATVAANITPTTEVKEETQAAVATQQLGNVNSATTQVAVPTAKQAEMPGKHVEAHVSADSKTALSNNNDVAVPEVKLKANASMVSMPYYFPAIDVANDTQAMANNDADEDNDDVTVSKAGSTKQGSASVDVKKRTSSNDYHGIKFKKKKRKSFTYGNIVRTKKH